MSHLDTVPWRDDMRPTHTSNPKVMVDARCESLCGPPSETPKLPITTVTNSHVKPVKAVKPRRGLAALLSCSCFGPSPSLAAVDAESHALVDAASSTPGSPAGSHGAVHSGATVPMSRKHSGRRGWDHVLQQQQQQDILPRGTTQYCTTFSDADWYDAMSHLSSAERQDTGSLQLTSSADDALLLEEVASQLQQLQRGGVPAKLSAVVNTKAPWIPDPPLVFAPPDLSFVPVPPHTGFAAYWQMIPERTSPHPQPIDVMINAGWLVRKVHASIPGLYLQETDSRLTVTCKPTFVPPGYPVYMEVYDKSNATEPTWSPRRDMHWGSCAGSIFMTGEGMLILRAIARPVFSKEVEFITEDYLVLEEGGQVVVDKMCCLEVATGRRAVQYQVGRRFDVPPKGAV